MFFRLSKFFLHAAVFTVAIMSVHTLFPFIVGKYTYFHLAVQLGLIFFLLGMLMEPEAGFYAARIKQLFRNPLVWAATAFTVFFLLAAFFGVRPHYSFWSNFERGEGGFQILHLYFYFLLLSVMFTEAKDWRKYFWLILAAATLVALYGFGAALKYVDAETGGPWYQTFKSFVGPGFNEGQYRIQGTIGNPAYVAAYLTFVLFFTVMLGFLTPPGKRKVRWTLFGFAAAFAIVFYLAGTRGALLGMMAGGFVWGLHLALAHKPWRRRILALAGAVFLALVLLVSFQNTSFVKNLPGSRIFDISFSTETFSTRTIMWSIAWRGWLHRPLLGYGPENFIYVFDRFFDPSYFHPAAGFGAWFDRAHSIIFDYLAETGIFGLLGYLSMFAAAWWLLLKRRILHVEEGASWRLPMAKSFMLAMPTAYLVQGIVLFDVLTIYLSLFSYLALVIFMTEPKPAAVAQFRPNGAIYGGVAAGIIIIFAGTYYGTLLPYAKASRFINAESRLQTINSVPQFEDVFDTVLKFPSPVGDEEIPKFLSSDIMNALPSIKDGPTAHALVAYLEPYLWPDDIRHLLIKAQFHAILWQNFKEPADYQIAVDTLKKAHEIAPTLPQPMIGLAGLYSLKGDRAGEAAVTKEFSKLWPSASATVR